MREEYKDFKKCDITHYSLLKKDRPRDAPASKNYIMIQIQGTFSLACLSLNFPELENIVGTLPKSLKLSLKCLKMT